MALLRIPRFLSGLLLFAAGYLIFVLGAAGTQIVLSPDVTATLTAHNLRWLQPVYMLTVAAGYSVGLVWGMYRMAVPTLRQVSLRLFFPEAMESRPKTVDVES